ncbi:ribonuclease [Bacillus sp. M6-12]|uniref:YihY/virulence factor BrkB family protein n=1 Tax=Bacillus sp. M6-12 TaxID=2054166 RepID=UPI000C77180D|nr:YihY/virulence factor BrkB family protein [Bacillus sp. M6-12]PLS14730.1 ribonuclease [Bacillus sp. M6-12]
MTLVTELIRRIHEDDVWGMAAQLAYFFLLSLFPLLLFLVTLLPYLPISPEDILAVIREYAPEDSMKLIEHNLGEIMNQNGRLLSFGAIATIWSASNGLASIVKAFNKAYDVKESRHFLLARAMSILLTFAMVFVFVIALLLPVFGMQIGVFLTSAYGFTDEFLQIWNAMRWLISFMLLFMVFTVLYWIAPNVKQKCRHVLPGAAFASVGWNFVSLAFAYYVESYGNYSATYGSIGGVIVLMIWFYLLGIIIIFGGEINAMSSARRNPNC